MHYSQRMNTIGSFNWHKHCCMGRIWYSKLNPFLFIERHADTNLWNSFIRGPPEHSATAVFIFFMAVVSKLMNCTPAVKLHCCRVSSTACTYILLLCIFRAPNTFITPAPDSIVARQCTRSDDVTLRIYLPHQCSTTLVSKWHKLQW